MTTVYQTGPGFYAANSTDCDPTVPEGMLRIYCVRLEAYDMPKAPEEIDAETTFEVLFAKSEKNPAIAKALLVLGDAIAANRELLKRDLGS